MHIRRRHLSVSSESIIFRQLTISYNITMFNKAFLFIITPLIIPILFTQRYVVIQTKSITHGLATCQESTRRENKATFSKRFLLLRPLLNLVQYYSLSWYNSCEMSISITDLLCHYVWFRQSKKNSQVYMREFLRTIL